MNIHEVNLGPGFAQMIIEHPALGGKRSFHEPWVIQIRESERVAYSLGILVEGELASMRTAMRELDGEYDYLNVEKQDWTDNKEKLDPITESEATDLHQVLSDVYDEKRLILNPYGQPMEFVFFHEQVQFALDRLLLVPRNYIPGTTFISGPGMESQVANRQ